MIKKTSRHGLLNIFALVTATAVLLGFGRASSPSSTATASVQEQPEVLGAQSPVRGPALAAQLASFNYTLSNLELQAKSALVYNEQSGQVLYAQNINQELPIASLTKLMTALVVYQQGDLSEVVTVQPGDLVKISPVLGLKAGDQVKVGDLFNAMLIGSENDAALTLAHYIERKTNVAFVELMNVAANSLGMSHSHFSNPLGFDSQYNYSTSSDLALLIAQTRQLGAFVNLGRTTDYSFNDAAGDKFFAKATNKLLTGHPEIEAIKTGYTPSALGSMSTGITVSGQNFISLVLDSQNREADTLKISEALQQLSQ